jgi:hypothetical protein
MAVVEVVVLADEEGGMVAEVEDPGTGTVLMPFSPAAPV